MAAVFDITVHAQGFTSQGIAAHQLGFDGARQGAAVEPSLCAGWHWVEGEGLDLWADRLGMVPIFLWQSGPRLVIADDLAALARALGGLPLADAALAVFLRAGFFLGDDTPLQGVRVLPPGLRRRWSGTALDLPEGVHCHPARTIPRAEAGEAYARLFAAAVQRRIPAAGRFALPLSGGRDSRHILLQLAAEGALPAQALTVETPLYGQAEVATAARLAGAFGVPHQVVRIAHERTVADELEKNRLTHCLSDEHGWYLRVLARLDPGCALIFDGIGGDVLSNGLFFDEALLRLMREGRHEEAARHLLPDVPLPYLTRAWRARFSHGLACQRLARELARHAAMPNPVQSFYFWNRTRREIALSPFCLAGRRGEVATPFLDPELVDFLLSLPAETFGAPGFHDEVIAASFPAAAAIPYAAKTRTPTGRGEEARIARSLLRFFARHPATPGVRAAHVWPRLLGALRRGGEAELWWARPVLYLHGLRALRG